MKNIVFFFAFVFASLFFVQRSDAQCYVRLEDASGFNTDEYQDSLQAAAARLCAIFDTTGFEGQFKVYDFGFYLHQENTTGGYPEPFAQKLAEVQALSPYYLLFGKQTDKSGVYTKFWISLKMPDTAQFSCMTVLQREVYEKRVERGTTGKYAEKNNSPDAYSEAEIAGIDELYKILKEINECCLYRNGNRVMGCDGCSDILVDFYLETFEQSTTDTEMSTFSNFSTQTLKENSNVKILKNGQHFYISTLLETVTAEFNQFTSFNLLSTSNNAFCNETIYDFESFTSNGEFSCWINLKQENSIDDTLFSIKIEWHPQNKSLCQNYSQAQFLINYMKCVIKGELGFEGNPCDIYFPPPFFPYPSTAINTFPDPPPIISRQDWGAAFADLSKGYEFIESDNLVEYYHSIVIHHSGNATNYPTIVSVQEEQMSGGFADIAYNYGIDKDGKIYYGRPLYIKQAHVKGGHKGLIGIVLLADLDTENSGLDGAEWIAENLLGDGDISDEMYQSLIDLVQYLKAKYGIDYLGAHKEVHALYNPTDNSNGDGRHCPGDLGTQLVDNLRVQIGMLFPIKI